MRRLEKKHMILSPQYFEPEVLMLNNLSPRQQALHERAVELCVKYEKDQSEIVNILIQINREKLFKLFKCASLFKYAVTDLKLSPPSAYMFISVSRQCAKHLPLRQAVERGSLTVAKAARLVSALNQDNCQALLEFAFNHTYDELDFEVARINPKSKTKDRMKPISADWVQLEGGISHDVAIKLKRAQSVMSTKTGVAADLNTTLNEALDLFLAKHDPVVRAERIQNKKARLSEAHKNKLCAHGVLKNKQTRRTPLTADQKRQVHLRDRGRCTYIHPDTGERCTNERWIETHHVVSVAEGGGNELENLTSLCSAHHDLVHQLSLPLEGQDS
jgi:hypothetical protein